MSDPTSATAAPDPALFTVTELAGVADAMRAGGAEVVGPLDATLISGGRSNLTARITDGTRTWVLRTPPRAGRTPSAHDVNREFTVTAALHAAGFPVAGAVVAVHDESLLGGPYAVWDFVTGRTIQHRDEIEALGTGDITALTDELVGTLAHLHGLDHGAIGLERFGRPDAYAERQFKRWSGQWSLVAGPDDVPLATLAERVIRKLGEHLPRQRRTGIVHGDYRVDNVLLAPASQAQPWRVRAVVDWELSTIGDPVADVAMMCAYRDPAFDLVLNLPTAWASDRLPSPESLAATYVERSGHDLVDFEAHLALAHVKVAVIAAGIDHRRRVAGARDDPGSATAASAVAPYLEAAWSHLRRA